MPSRQMIGIFSFLFHAASICSRATAAEEADKPEKPLFTRKEDVIYGRKYGVALTMDVFTPNENANGAGVIWVVSGGWVSSHDAINAVKFWAGSELLNRGYTLFAVVHGSQPKFTIPEILQDMNRSVRFIRTHAADYRIDPNRIGITGGSAGGHLSLMQGTTGDDGDSKAADPVDRASSRVQAVSCFFPPTDFLNYGKSGEIGLGRGLLKNFRPPFDFVEFHSHNESNNFAGELVPVKDEIRVLEIGRQISPINFVSADDAPTRIIHGDNDVLVPIEQAERIVGKFHEVGVPADLIVKKGAGHGWLNLDADAPAIADWFDKYLAKNSQHAK